jgi:hypothetical protein
LQVVAAVVAAALVKAAVVAVLEVINYLQVKD